MAASCWESSAWFSNVVLFRQNHRFFINKHYGGEEECLQHILQSLFSEGGPDTMKLHLLGLIQEYADVLLLQPHSVEEVVGSLVNLFQQKRNESVVVLCNQIIVSCTNILIQFNALCEMTDLLCTFIRVLLDVINDFNSTRNAYLRSISCQCLVQFEERYPVEKTNACQSYLSLFSKVLKNAVCNLAKHDERSQHEKSVTEFLVQKIDSLKHFQPKDVIESVYTSNEMNNRVSPDTPFSISQVVDTKELSRSISFVVHSFPLMTAPVKFFNIKSLTDIVQVATSVSPVVFKSEWLKRVCSFDIMSLYSSVYQLKLHDPLYNATDEEIILYHTILSMKHLCLPTLHKLLMGHWLLYWPLPRGNQLGFVVNDGQLARLIPTVFDSCDLQISKLVLLSKVLPARMSSDGLSACLMGSVLPLLKPLQAGTSGRSTSAIFKVFYQFYTQHPGAYLSRDIQKCIMDSTKAHPKLVPNIVNFVQAVKMKMPQSNICDTLYLPLVQHIIQSDPESGTMTKDDELRHHLSLLKEAATSPGLPAKEMLIYLTNMLNENLSTTTTRFDWNVGHDFLDVCSSLLGSKRAVDHIKALGDLLYFLSSEYKDIDVRDRAKQYYAMLTCLCPKKVSSLLEQESAQGEKQNLVNIVQGSGYQSGYDSVIQLDDPVFEFIPCSKSLKEAVLDYSNKRSEESLPDDDNHLLDKLLNHGKGCDTAINLHYSVQMKHADIGEAYAITFQFETGESIKPLTDIKIPYLKRITQQDSVLVDSLSRMSAVGITIVPTTPVPCKVQVRSFFIGGDGRSYICNPDPLYIGMSQLRCPLPPLQPLPLIRKQDAYEALWTNIGNRKDFSESLLVVPRSPESLSSFVERTFDSFVVTVERLGTKSELAKVGIFFPPCSSCYLNIQQLDEDRLVFVIRTDNVEILPLLQSYLKLL